MKRFFFALFLTCTYLGCPKVFGRNLIEEGFVPSAQDISKFKNKSEMVKYYENFYRDKEEQLLNSLLVKTGTSKTEFEKKVNDTEEDRKISVERYRKTYDYKESELQKTKQKPDLEKLFGYDPYKIIESFLKSINKNPQDFGISPQFDLNEPSDDDYVAGFYTGYNNSIYFPKTTFTQEEFEGAIAHEMQHIKNFDFSRKLALDDFIRGKGLENEFKKFVWLTEIRCDILGSLQDISCAKGAFSSFVKELKTLPSTITGEDDEHPCHVDRIEYLTTLVKQMEMMQNKKC